MEMSLPVHMSKTITVLVVLALVFTALFVSVVPTTAKLNVKKMWGKGNPLRELLV